MELALPLPLSSETVPPPISPVLTTPFGGAVRILSLLRWSIVGALLTLLIAPAAITLVTGTQLVVVDGKSMTPTYDFGDLVLIGSPTPEDFQPDHVVTVGRPDGSMYTHRIQEITDGKALLKGDGNTAADPDTITYDQLVGAVRGHIGSPLAPFLAYVQTTPARISLAVLILALIIFPLERRPASATKDNISNAEETNPRPEDDSSPTTSDEAAPALEDIFGLSEQGRAHPEEPLLLPPGEQHTHTRRQYHQG